MTDDVADMADDSPVADAAPGAMTDESRVADDVDAALVAAGLLDPGAPGAADRSTALRLLLDRGATIDDLVEYRDDLGVLAGRIVTSGPLTLTRRQLAERAGLSLDVVERLSLAVGIADPGPDVLSASEGDVALVATFAAATAIFGEAVALQLARVVGAVTAKMADAVVSAYRTTAGPQAVAEDDTGLAIVQSNIAMGELLSPFMAAIEQLMRRHTVSLIRPLAADASNDADRQILAIGFVDLVGSTALAARLSTAELSAALSAFESTACDTVIAHGARVVKLIGDEVMFTTADPAAAAAIAHDLTDAFASHAVLPPVRSGIAFGEVVTRDGDCFGKVVNLAARIVDCAAPGDVLVDHAMARAVAPAGWPATPAGCETLKGFDEPVALLRLRRRSAGS